MLEWTWLEGPCGLALMPTSGSRMQTVRNRSVLVDWGHRRLCFLNEAPVEDIVRLLDANSKAKGKVLVAMAIDKEQKRPQPSRTRP